MRALPQGIRMTSHMAVIAGEKALTEHYKRMGIDAVVEYTGNPVVFRSYFAIKGNPKVSILIPNKDHTADLEKMRDLHYGKKHMEKF